MLTERDKMFGDGNGYSENKFTEEEIEQMEEIFERFIEKLQNDEIEKFEYECNSRLGWGVRVNTLTWEEEIHP